MNNKPKAVDPIPEEFSSYEAAAEFWDTHDTTDYLDNFETVPLEAELQERHFEVEIDEDLIQVLYQQAQEQGIAVSQLVNDVLREKWEEGQNGACPQNPPILALPVEDQLFRFGTSKGIQRLNEFVLENFIAGDPAYKLWNDIMRAVTMDGSTPVP
ncbi:MAG: CopG family antitoxin, partial [Cyanobacteria bacterium P01_G01_bin.49]